MSEKLTYYCKFVDPNTFNEKLASFNANSYEEAEIKMIKFAKSLYTAKGLGIDVKDITNATS